MKEYINLAFYLLEKEGIPDSDRQKGMHMLNTSKAYMDEGEIRRYQQHLQLQNNKKARRLLSSDHRHNGNA